MPRIRAIHKLVFSNQPVLPIKEYHTLSTISPVSVGVPSHVCIPSSIASLLLAKPCGYIRIDSNRVALALEQLHLLNCQLVKRGAVTTNCQHAAILTSGTRDGNVTLELHLCHVNCTCGCGKTWYCMKNETMCLDGVLSWVLSSDSNLRFYLPADSADSYDASSRRLCTDAGTDALYMMAEACTLKQHGSIDYSNSVCSGCFKSFTSPPKWCSGCALTALYCSKECQRKTYKYHKVVCQLNSFMLMRTWN